MGKITDRRFQTLLSLDLKNEFLVYSLLFLTNISLKLFLVFMRPAINKDGALYLICAQFISEGRFNKALGLFPYPFFPYMISIIHAIVPHWIISGYILSIVPASLSVIPFYIISKYIYERKIAIWSCIFFILAPLPNEFFTWIGRDGLFILLSLASISMLFVATNKPYSLRFLYVGLIFSCLASMFRVEGIVVLAIMIASIIFHIREKRLLLFASILSFTMVLIIIVSLPESIKSQLRISQLLQEISGLFNLEFLNTYRQIYSALKEIQYQLPGSRWAQNFMEIARHYMLVIYLIGLLESIVRVISPLFIPFVIYGILKTYTERDKNQELYTCLLLLITLVVLIPPMWRLITLNFLSYRYVFLPAFLLMIFTGKGWTHLCSIFRTRQILTVLMAVIILGGSISYTTYRFSMMDSTIMQILPKLRKANIPGKELFITNDPRIAFYLKSKDTFLYIIDPDPVRMEKEGVKKEVRYILLTVSQKKAKDLVGKFKEYEVIRQYKGSLTTIIIAERKSKNINIM